jgi:hypothetical protein
MCSENLRYGGNQKNFNFDKYCTAHVEQHNQHAALTEFDVTTLEENMKIHYFEDRITDLLFASVKSIIMVDPQKFQEFDAVMQLYVNLKCSQKSEALTYQACNVSAVQGRGGGRQGCQGPGGGGGGGPNACAHELVPQEEIKKMTHIVNKHYPTSNYNKFTRPRRQSFGSSRIPGRPLGLDPQAERPTRASHCGRVDICHYCCFCGSIGYL